MSGPTPNAEYVRPDCEQFSLVRKQGALGRVLRTDHFGVFVEWDDGPGYAHATDLVPVGGAIGTYVSDLLSIIRWLHPDDSVDPRSMEVIRRQLGNRAAVLLNDVMLAAHIDGSGGVLLTSDTNPHGVKVGQVWGDNRKAGWRVGVRTLCEEACLLGGQFTEPHAHVVGWDNRMRPASRNRMPLARFARYFLMDTGSR